MPERNKKDYLVIPEECADISIGNWKILYGIIIKLSVKTGYCAAHNKTLARLHHSSVRSIQRWLKALTQEAVISIEYVPRCNNEQIIERRITLTKALT